MNRIFQATTFLLIFGIPGYIFVTKEYTYVHNQPVFWWVGIIFICFGGIGAILIFLNKD